MLCTRDLLCPYVYVFVVMPAAIFTWMDAWSLNHSSGGKPQVTTLGTAGTYLQHRSPHRERNRLPAAVAASSLLGVLYNLNANSPQMR